MAATMGNEGAVLKIVDGLKLINAALMAGLPRTIAVIKPHYMLANFPFLADKN